MRAAAVFAAMGVYWLAPLSALPLSHCGEPPAPMVAPAVDMGHDLEPADLASCTHPGDHTPAPYCPCPCRPVPPARKVDSKRASMGHGGAGCPSGSCD